jgi:SAM-dependent methyltransferase
VSAERDPEPRRPGWLLDETRSAGRENLDPGHVSRYDDKEDAGASAEVELLASLGMDEHATVVDLGAGTGQLAIAVAASCGRVIAVDVSPPMRERLRAKAAAANIGNLEIVAGGFLTYEHAGPPADFVYSRYALHHLPDAWKVHALTRIHRMLRPGGIFRLWDVVYGFEPQELEERVEAWCAGGSGGSGGVGDGWHRDELEEHVRDESSTFTWLLEPMLERTGFVIKDASYSRDAFFARYVLEPA